MTTFWTSFFNLDILMPALPVLWRGLLHTLQLALFGIIVGVLGGIALALLGTSPHRYLRIPAMLWTDLFRALPPLVLLILLYAGPPFIGLDLGAWGAVILTFFLNTGAYYGEVFRAGLESVEKGQAESARSTGLTYLQTLRFVVFPQAVRSVLPDLVSNTIEIVKLTSIASVVALPELLFEARQIQNAAYNPSPLFAAALIYFVILWPLVRWISRLERRLA
jgi:polar amino acid transport system permease protein